MQTICNKNIVSLHLASRMKKKIPITIITGFAHAGKTSVLLELLRKRNTEQRPAIIMNDIAEVVTATDKVREALGSANQHLLELPNGCICCTLKDVFLQAVETIAGSSVDHLYIEGNAAAEPSLIQEFLEESAFADQICIENMITVIDASVFLQDFLSTDALRQRGLVALSYDDRIVSEVLAEQVECADTLVITKPDLVSETDVMFLHAALTALNPRANIVFSGEKRGQIDTGPLEKFIFTANRPFHPHRLHAALSTNVFRSVLRTRGIAWIATRQEYKVRWSQTGSICSLEADGPWWNPGSSKEEEQFNAQWFEACGRRSQEIEFIGTDSSVQQLKKLLKSCLLTEVEMELGPDLWAHFNDPFDDWIHDMDRSLFVVRERSVLPSYVRGSSQ